MLALVGITALLVAILFGAGVRLLSVTTEDMQQLERTNAVSRALGSRVGQLSGWVRDVREWVDSTPLPAGLAALRDSLQRAPGRAAPQAFTDVSTAMRLPVASVDIEASALERELATAIANLELGRGAQARRWLRMAEGRQTRLAELAEDTQVLGLQDLLASRIEFQRAARRAALLFLLAGVLLLGASVWLVLFLGGRVLQPLSSLDQALSLVEAGDLHARLPTHRNDEVGRLLSHFNRVTAVLRERAEQQGRLAAAGELVASVAHEVNNPLQAIGLTAQGMLALPDLSPELREDAEQILRQSERAGVLVRGFLRFVKPRQVEPPRADVNTVVQEALDLLGYQFGVHGVEAEFVPEATDPVAACAPSGIEQVVVNLLANAIQAMAGGAGPRAVRVTTRLAGARVEVDVADTGPGVPRPERDQVFRPFHTTKGEGGTGLGLYISREIARGAGGDLLLLDASAGACFRLVLPRAEAPAPTEPSPAAPPLRGVLTGRRILLADDDDAVRSPMARALRAVGGEVVEARNGREALQVLDRTAIDAIVLDLRMPGMSGTEVLRDLQGRRPDLVGRIVVVSGDLHELREVRLPPEQLLAKPVPLEQLIERVGRIAQGARPAPPS